MPVFQSFSTLTHAPSVPAPAQMLTPENLGNVLKTLGISNYRSALKPFLEALNSLGDSQKASFCGTLLGFGQSFPYPGPESRSPLQQSFLFELASVVAPAWAARSARADFDAIHDEKTKTEFREKYGYFTGRAFATYDGANNNCGQYVLKKYYAALSPFFSSELVDELGPDHFRKGKKEFFGRPKDFYWGNRTGDLVPRIDVLAWQKIPDKEPYLAGNRVVFIALSIPKNYRKLRETLQIGDVIHTTENAHGTGRGHIGIWDGEKVVNLGQPLYCEKLEKFLARNVGNVRVDRLARLDADITASVRGMFDMNPWKAPIRRESDYSFNK